jgi:hypothetical protein
MQVLESILRYVQIQNVRDAFIESLFIAFGVWSLCICINFVLNKYKKYDFGGCRVCRCFELSFLIALLLFLTSTASPFCTIFVPFLSTALYINTN